jgi:cellulose synthase/poly-beta-1,6-N-acetylglucosamine synthase-like glycosyltransferase
MLSEFENTIFCISQVLQVLVFVGGCYFFCISIFGLIINKENSTTQSKPTKKFALVIAAYNEELVIAHIIESLLRQNYPRNLYDIYVVADNCTDNTANIARAHGAIVFTRTNNHERGKGYALEWMFSKLHSMENTYDAVCVFDADNLVSSNFLAEVNKLLCKGHKVVQGYLDSKNPYDSWITISYSIAFWLSNRIFQLPRYNLGLSCSLCGTGFCVDTEVLRKIGWGATCLTEDLEFTMKLALKGIKIAWAHNAVVYDEKPLTLKQSWKQRKRWMQGHADCAIRFVAPLFKRAFKEGDLTSFDCALYLFQPIRFLLIGVITLMMWAQTIYPDSPFFNLRSFFPNFIWETYVILQFFYGPLIILLEKKFKTETIIGFVIYPFYCLTWLPITIQGFLSKDNKIWSHTIHTREIKISELEEV